MDEVAPSTDSWSETSGAGTYDETTYPVIPHNKGSYKDLITITFTSSTEFSVSGTDLGSLGTGFVITADCTPTHPTNGSDMFTLDKDGWGGTWAGGDTITFELYPACQGIWLKEVVPSGTTQEPHNLIVLGWYTE